MVPLRVQCEDDFYRSNRRKGGSSVTIQNMFVFLSEGASLFPALRSLGAARATMRLRPRGNNRGHYTNTHVVLHARMWCYTAALRLQTRCAGRVDVMQRVQLHDEVGPVG